MCPLSTNLMEELLKVGIALSSTHDLKKLLNMILTESMRFTNADAGTLYLADNNTLKAEIAHCNTFVKKWGYEEAQRKFTSFTLPVNMKSIAGAAATTKDVINIADVQDTTVNTGFEYNPAFDHANDYSTHSNLVVPMLNRENQITGVLQLINCLTGEQITAFNNSAVRLAQALASQAAVAIENARLTQSLEDAHLDTLNRLGVAAEWRDKETANHITRVSKFSGIIAKGLGWTENDSELLVNASPMHDVGKLGIPDAILHKPGRLEQDERDIMETHTIIGSKIMADSNNPVMHLAQVVALQHHEKWNGKGYPKGLKGEDIDPAARIVALADVYDALSSRRCYKPAFPEEKVLAIINEENGKHFDPELVTVLLNNLEQIREVRDNYADSEEDFAKFRSYDELKATS